MKPLQYLIDQYVKLAQSLHPDLPESATERQSPYDIEIESNKSFITPRINYNLNNLIDQQVPHSTWVEWFIKNKKNLQYKIPWMQYDMEFDRDGNKYLLLMADYAEYRIYNKYTNPSDLIKPRFDLLVGHKNIPNLFMVTGKKITQDQFDRMERPKHHGFYQWLYWSLEKLFGNPYSVNAYDYGIEQNVERLINSPKFKKLEAQFESQPRLLGEGVDGIAFSIAPDKVLKIFKDKSLFNKAREDWGRLFDHPELAKNEALIYEVDTFGDFNVGISDEPGQPIYYSIVSRYKKIPTKLDGVLGSLMYQIKVAIRKYFDQIKPLITMVGDKDQHKKVKEFISEISEKIEQDLVDDFDWSKLITQISSNIPDINRNWLKALIEEMILKIITGRYDLHAGNIGLTQNGEFRFFDSFHEGQKFL